ncbi:MAG TPA: galactitol-1-phosphate 5-dehydrogenase [Gammaproteobacteria bacterium]|mgnify:CR=1 FL=1|jgi:alcohol dehydrogenase|nr:galactitol-1-phosphate 5-dehydrogenase [Acidiferrobacteraceae bacterium]MDP6552565.1 alcohol dehydrogenase catalytic domain-containing protein [Arenicellales bacterium]MDP6791263.1 alcohol dehydrogenase catalytic domain-containing protein [Arenicellales bacterium]MDP6918326.1 alcohol dehydrogenase catalytic domain-containing protein [Arenicellales bacterium]HCX88509.1 galactitol-1-phosphate 5-dehydrogenase [Gammaproteobacteria bacterium]|tara:strand:+ start:1840 stop:2832 length:993 start_codon:yes stop_codon:yes gene_type:complete
MQALVYIANEQMAFREEADAEVLGPGEALVAIEAVGICGSDMHAYLGHDPRRVPPLILGHEAAGKVLDGELSGKRVVINPLITCGRCSHCLDGRQNLCAERDLIGMYRPGAFAERVAIPETNLIEIPGDMDASLAALTEPAATATHAVNLAERSLARPISETRALVIGGGSVGLFAALTLHHRGVFDLMLADTNPLRRASAQKTAVATVINPIDQSAPDSTFDLVVDAVGGKASRQAAIAAVVAGGVVMHIGLMDNDDGVDVRRITLQEITFIGTYTYTPLDLRTTLAQLHAGALGPLDWIEERPLAEGGTAFAELHAGRCGAPKVILRP